MQSDTLLPANIYIFEQQIHWNIWTRPCSLFISTKISMVSMFQKDWNKIRTINQYWYVTNDKKRVRYGIYHPIHQYAKANDKYKEDLIKKDSLYLLHWVANSLYGWAMSQNLHVYNSEWEENRPWFDENFIKN